MVDAHEGPEPTLPGALIDVCCHLDAEVFDGDRAEVLARAARAGVTRVVIAGYLPDTYRRARALRSADVRVAIGLHPWALAEPDLRSERAIDEAITALGDADADALGEIGLDAAFAERSGVSLDRQAEVFARALDAANGRPILLHVVHAHARARALTGERRGLVLHDFGGSAEEARAWLRLGACLSFGGRVADPRFRRAREAARAAPLDRLLLESDAPERPPPGFGSARNEPGSLVLVARALAELRGEPWERIAEHARANAERLFFSRGIDPDAGRIDRPGPLC